MRGRGMSEVGRFRRESRSSIILKVSISYTLHLM